MLILGIVLLAIAVLFGLTALFLRTSRKKTPDFVKRYLLFFAWIVLIVCLIMTLNCSLLYHASTFSDRYMKDARESTLEDFVRLRNQVAARCNELSAMMERDERGYVVYQSHGAAEEEEVSIQDMARYTMEQLGEEYPQLAGYYPPPKPLFFSDFMCQQNMLGWYFPFSMEANYNDVAYIMNQPASMCHELAHLKGFIYEDEANFIGYLACIRSEDPFIRYSGYLSVLGYLERDLYKIMEENPEAFAIVYEKQGLVELLDIVYEDDVFVVEEEWDRIEGNAVLDSETVSRATDNFLDTTLKANGVSDGIISYSRVVELMLKYESQAVKNKLEIN